MTISPIEITEGLISLAEGALSGASLDAIQLYTENFIPLFLGAFFTASRDKLESRMPTKPVESGTNVNFNIIRMPIEIELIATFTGEFYIALYQQLVYAFTISQNLILQNLASLYFNMRIKEISVVGDNQKAKTLVARVILREIITYEALFEDSDQKNYKPSKPKDQKTVERGTVQPSENSHFLDWAQGKSPLFN